MKQGKNIYVIYNLIDKKDDEGYDMYDAVSIINHDQQIFFSPNLTRFIEYDKREKMFKIQILKLDPSVMTMNRCID